MKLLFLDIDGILNTPNFIQTHCETNNIPNARHYPNWDEFLIPDKIDLLNVTLDAINDVKIVIHSSWGKMKYDDEK